jgi:hypothetical protein
MPEREKTLAELAATVPEPEGPPMHPDPESMSPQLAGTTPRDVAKSVGGASPAFAPSTDLADAAASAVDEALNVFKAARRTPGANMPETNLIASISGSMGSPFRSRTPETTGASTSTISAPPSRRVDVGDPDEVRSNLAGFQSGIGRADRED